MQYFPVLFSSPSPTPILFSEQLMLLGLRVIGRDRNVLWEMLIGACACHRVGTLINSLSVDYVKSKPDGRGRTSLDVFGKFVLPMVAADLFFPPIIKTDIKR